MKTYNKQIAIYCDIEYDWRCIGEAHSVLNWWEGKTIAHKQFKKEGWIIGIKEGKDICPYCQTKLTNK